MVFVLMELLLIINILVSQTECFLNPLRVPRKKVFGKDDWMHLLSITFNQILLLLV